MAKLFNPSARSRIREHNQRVRLLTRSFRQGRRDLQREILGLTARELYMAAKSSRGRVREILMARAAYYHALADPGKKN